MYSRGSRLQLALAVALSIGAIGCNKKPAPPPDAPPASPVAVTKPAARDDRPVIVAFGDSLTAGYGTDAGNSYPDYLERDLNAKGFHYHVVNAGISGNTTMVPTTSSKAAKPVSVKASATRLRRMKLRLSCCS